MNPFDDIAMHARAVARSDAVGSTRDQGRPSYRWFRIVVTFVIGCIQVLPALPALLFDLVMPPPLILMTSASVLAMTALLLNEWLLRPRERYGVFRALAISTGLALAVGAIVSLVVLELTEAYAARHFPPPPFPIPTIGALVLGASSSLVQVGYWAIAFVIPASVEEQRVRALEIENLRLEASELRAQTELLRLRSQLEPHFLLNTLNLIAGLVTSDPPMARRVLATLGELLTDGLNDARVSSTVQDEVAWLRRYMDILTARFADKLRVTWQIKGSVALAPLPRLILQPLVENAVRHGALRNPEGGHVTIRIERAPFQDKDCVVCTVHDDGPGLGAPREGAIGLDNVSKRLALSHPGAQLIMQSDEKGTTACVVIPYVSDPLSSLPPTN